MTQKITVAVIHGLGKQEPGFADEMRDELKGRFVLENRAHSSEERRHLARFIQAIDWVEEKGGLDVMPDLPEDDEERLERRLALPWD